MSTKSFEEAMEDALRYLSRPQLRIALQKGQIYPPGPRAPWGPPGAMMNGQRSAAQTVLTPTGPIVVPGGSGVPAANKRNNGKTTALVEESIAQMTYGRRVLFFSATMASSSNAFRTFQRLCANKNLVVAKTNGTSAELDPVRYPNNWIFFESSTIASPQLFRVLPQYDVVVVDDGHLMDPKFLSGLLFNLPTGTRFIDLPALGSTGATPTNGPLPTNPTPSQSIHPTPSQSIHPTPSQSIHPFWPTAPSSVPAPQVAKAAAKPACEGCSCELSATLDAYYGSDARGKTHCEPCRRKKGIR